MKFLNDYMEEKQTELFKATGTFFAFSVEQLNEGLKINGRPEEDHVNMGSGMFCLKENAKKLSKGLFNIYEEGIKEDIKENGPESILKREHINHETSYTGEAEQALDALEDYIVNNRELFPNKLIKKVFKGIWGVDEWLENKGL